MGSVANFCERLVEEEGVLLLPPRIYLSDLMEAPADHFQIGFGRANIADGLTALRRYLERHRNDIAA